MFVTVTDGPVERRGHSRTEVSRSATLDFGRMLPKRPCTIKNISDGGARLHVGLLIGLPDQFFIAISPVPMQRRDCRLVWASEFEVGIRFV
jgi:hypothetical protein